MVNLLIPAAGKGSRFDGVFVEPKPFIPIENSVMLELAIESLIKYYTNDINIYVCLQKSHSVYENKLDKIKNKYKLHIMYIDYYTSGQAETVDLMLKNIDNNGPILIANCDQIIEWNIDDFLHYCMQFDLDGCIPVFNSSEDKWSYALVDIGNFVTMTAEKKVISNFATVGVYYWKNKKILKSSIDKMFEAKDITNNEVYICPAYNYLIKDGGRVKIWQNIEMFGVGTPNDLKEYIDKRFK
jgi:dTDP-glucose pyrophosphorylase